MVQRFHVIVIGGGSAGYAAARAAGERDVRVALVEQGPFGGLCILNGCMPSKTLIRSGDVLQLIRKSKELGLLVDQHVGIDWPAIQRRKQRLIDEFTDYRVDKIHTLKNVTVIEGKARFLEPHTIEVGDQRYEGNAFIICTGSRPHVPDIPGLAAAGYITSDEALALPRLPASLIILGGGVIAVELGQLFHRLGVPTTIVHRSTGLLNREDEDVSQTLTSLMREEGMVILDGASHGRVESASGNQVVHFEREGRQESVSGETLLVALGRLANVASLNLAAAGVELSFGAIRVDAELRTNVRHIFAAGDCTTGVPVVHEAIAQGEVAACNAVTPDHPRCIDNRTAAWAVFCDPNFARVGLSERDALAFNRPYLVATYPFSEHGRALTMNTPEGFVKLLADPASGEILGGQVMGAEGADLIHEIMVAIHARLTVHALAELPHLHPTLAEIWTYPAEELAGKIPRL